MAIWFPTPRPTSTTGGSSSSMTLPASAVTFKAIASLAGSALRLLPAVGIGESAPRSTTSTPRSLSTTSASRYSPTRTQSQLPSGPFAATLPSLRCTSPSPSAKTTTDPSPATSTWQS